MTRKVFYSFHYAADSWRASMIRNIGTLEGNKPAEDNDWEEVERGGDKAIQKWINSQLDGRSCTIVLIGSQTANRKWINYEIEQSWKKGKGLLGIHVHKLEDKNQKQSYKGKNPFDYVKDENGVELSEFIKTYDSPVATSQGTHSYIRENLSSWVEAAMRNAN